MPVEHLNGIYLSASIDAHMAAWVLSGQVETAKYAQLAFSGRAGV